MKKVDKIICNCDICGKELQLLPWEFKRSEKHFCSRECYWIERKDPKYTEVSRAKVMENHKLGLNNPSGDKAYNWRGGKNKCVDCGKLLSDRNSQRCYSCGRKHSWASKGCFPIITLTCSICGKVYETKKVNVDVQAKEHYCSQECASKGVSKRSRGRILNPDRIPQAIFNEIRQSYFYTNWRTVCFTRDNYKCQHCGLKGKLHVHHKKTVMSLVKKYNVITKEQSYNISEFWDIDNGITLCSSCHKVEHRRLKQVK